METIENIIEALIILKSRFYYLDPEVTFTSEFLEVKFDINGIVNIFMVDCAGLNIKLEHKWYSYYFEDDNWKEDFISLLSNYKVK